MSMRFSLAKATGATLGWGLRNVARRDGANMPGKVASRIDPQFIEHLTPRLQKGSIVIVGTNGKTTVTNLVADIVERSGESVICNRTGANMRGGVATALMQGKSADWGVIECDELWLAKVLPQLRANYVLLLNLFRDQLDRCGEIEIIQDSIVSALKSSPETVLIYNADDPLCAMIAERAGALEERTSTPSIAFGTDESMGLAQNVVSDATMCQRCSSMFEYTYRQYGQLGAYKCPTCGFARPQLDYAATDINLGVRGLSFTLGTPASADGAAGGGSAADGATGSGAAGDGSASADDGMSKAAVAHEIHAPFSGAYMVYNLMAAAIAAHMLDCPASCVQEAIDAFDPKNGRLQDYVIDGRHVLLNLAKNPTGFNQNLKIIAGDKGPKAVAFFINDKEADGHDISWIWDIDFEELVAQQDCFVFAGGIRRHDLRVRLKYAGVDAQLVDGMEDVFAALPALDGLPRDAGVYAIANYTSLPGVKSSLDAAARNASTPSDAAGRGAATPPGDDDRDADSASHDVRRTAAAPADSDDATDEVAGSDTAPPSRIPTETAENAASSAPATAGASASAPAVATANADASPLVIAHLFPDLMNLYGDGGNVRILEQRCRWRDIPVRIARIRHGDAVDLAEVDLVFLGGGPDREQRLASEQLMAMRDDLARYVDDDGAMLAICGGYQILGRTWLLDGEEVPGLGIIDAETRRPGTSSDRLTDNIALRSPLGTHPVIGYENHAGRTFLGDGAQCFGTVVSSVGGGNNGEDKTDGVLYRNVIATYSHGPLLSKNPEIADFLITCALKRRATRLGRTEDAPSTLAQLDDEAELAANAFMCDVLGVSKNA